MYTATISIIICTRNRAESLRLTLESIGKVTVPGGCAAELLVVDNGSIDQTHSVVSQARIGNMNLRYVSEPKLGQSHARNAGMFVALGEFIVFTDDDVRPDANWIERLAGPLLRRDCDAVVGRIDMAEYLNRSWMKLVHKICLAASGTVVGQQVELIGANMGFHRCVLERVPAFDPELGPGALGFADETLFCWQLIKAGFRLRAVPDARVVHHFESSRLLRSEWLSAARKRGACMGYLLHHWHHEELRYPRLRSFYLVAKLRLRRIVQPPVSMDAEGSAPWEISYVAHIEKCKQFIKERNRPRNYATHGLKRLDYQPRTVSELPAVSTRC